MATDLGEPRKQRRLTAVTVELADGLDQCALHNVLQAGRVQCRATCDVSDEAARADVKEFIEGALVSRAHPFHQRAIRLVHPVASLRAYDRAMRLDVT